MRIIEIISEDKIEEGWKSNIAAGALAVGALAGINNYNSAPKEHPGKIQATHQIATPKNKNFDVPTISGTSMEATLKKKAIAAGIKGEELAQFLAQCAHESHLFTKAREHGSEDYFNKKYDKSQAPKTAKLLGNTKVGDGVKFRGAGPLQVTGKFWFNQAGKELNIPLVSHPELADKEDVGVDLAVWWWMKNVHPRISDFTDTKAVTRIINTKLDKLDRREGLFNQYIQSAKDSK